MVYNQLFHNWLFHLACEWERGFACILGMMKDESEMNMCTNMLNMKWKSILLLFWKMKISLMGMEDNYWLILIVTPTFWIVITMVDFAYIHISENKEPAYDSDIFSHVLQNKRNFPLSYRYNVQIEMTNK